MHYGATFCLKLLLFPAVSKCGLQENMRKMIINNTFWMSCKKNYNHRNAVYQESENSSEVTILAGLWLPTFRKLSEWIKTIYFNVCAHSWNAWISWKKHLQSSQCTITNVSKLLHLSDAYQHCYTLRFVTISTLLQNCGFTKVITERKKTPLVLPLNSYYLSPKKLLGNHGAQLGNFPNRAQCLYCTARNAVVVLTLQWLGKTLLWSNTWSQTPSDMPSRLPPTARLKRQKAIRNV